MTEAASALSVVAACHNVAPYLRAAIDSVLAQRTQAAEIVVCDDASTDGSSEILSTYGDVLTVVTHGSRRGAAAAKNTAAQAAHGEFLALLDCDDEFGFGRLDAVTRVLAGDVEPGILTTDAWVANGRDVVGRWYSDAYPLPRQDIRLDILSRNPVFSHVVISRQLFLDHGGFDERVSHASDWEAWIRLVLAGVPVTVINRPLSRYRLHHASTSTDITASLQSRLRFLADVAERSDLSEAEREVLATTRSRFEDDLDREQMRADLLAGKPSARRRAVAVAADPGQPGRSRLLATAAAAWPAAAGRAERRRTATHWRDSGGVLRSNPKAVSARDQRPTARARRPRILLTLPDVPWPQDRGKRVRCGMTLRALADIGDVDVLVLNDDNTPAVPPPGVQPYRMAQVRLQLQPRWRAIGRLAKGLPWQMAAHVWTGAAEVLGRWHETYDVAWFGATDHAVVLRNRIEARTTVVDMDDVETAKWRGYLALPHSHIPDHRLTRLQRRLEVPMWARLERLVGRRADVVVVCSDLDRERLGGSNTVVVPNCLPDPGPVPDPRPRVPGLLVMVANYDQDANRDAAEFLAREVLPLLHRTHPDARVALVGRHGEARLTDLHGLPGVEVVGTVDDPLTEVRRAAVVVAPIRFGGGTRIKVLEAFAAGVPAVGTSLSCEGLAVTPGVDMLVADDAAGLAAACGRLLDDPDLGDALARAARLTYELHYRPVAAETIVADLVADLVSQQT